MKKIKIKVKHVFYIVLVLILMRFLIIPQGIYLAAKISEKKDIEVSKVLFKRFAKIAVGKEERAKAIYSLAESIVPNSHSREYRMIIFPSIMTTGNNTTSEMIDNACKYYKEIIEKYENTAYYNKAYGNIINLYMINGRHQEAMKLIEKGIKSSNKGIKVLSTKYKMVYLIAERKYDEGISLGEGLIKNGNGDNDVYMLVGDMKLYSRKYEEARAMYKKIDTLNNSKKTEEEKNFYYYNGDADFYSRLRFIDKVLLKKEGNSTLCGNVKINGKPVPLALVYVREIDDNELGSFIGQEKEGIMAVTDFDGNYRIEGIQNGKYEVGVDVPVVDLYNTTYQTPKEGYAILKGEATKEFNFTFVPPIKVSKPKGTVSLIDNKVCLEWQKVDGAAYYRINVVEFQNPDEMKGNSVSGPITEEIYGTKATLNINKINIATRGVMSNDKRVPNPQAYLGSFYPGCKTPIFITVYDGENRCIGSSNSLKMEAKDMIIVSTSEKGLTEGDRLILKGEPEKALEFYEGTLKKSPNDIHALEVLSKIYRVGTKFNYDKNQPYEKIENQNMERAIHLIQSLYNITGNNEYIKSLTYLIDSSKDEQRKILEELKKLPESELDSQEYHFMADVCLKLEDYKSADMYFEKAWEKSSSYVSMDSVILKLYLNDNAAAIKKTDNMRELNLYKINKDELMEAARNLNNVDKNSEDYIKFKKAIKLLLVKNDGYREEYKITSDSIQNKQLRNFIKQLNLWYGI